MEGVKSSGHGGIKTKLKKIMETFWNLNVFNTFIVVELFDLSVSAFCLVIKSRATHAY